VDTKEGKVTASVEEIATYNCVGSAGNGEKAFSICEYSAPRAGIFEASMSPPGYPSARLPLFGNVDASLDTQFLRPTACEAFPSSPISPKTAIAWEQTAFRRCRAPAAPLAERWR
jgi:hypothetical protein